MNDMNHHVLTYSAMTFTPLHTWQLAPQIILLRRRHAKRNIYAVIHFVSARLGTDEASYLHNCSSLLSHIGISETKREIPQAHPRGG